MLAWLRRGVQPDDRLRDGLRLAIGVLIGAIVLRTWLIQGICIPVVVASGSMATAFLGPHRVLECDRCGTTFVVGADRSVRGGRAICPACGNRAIGIDGAPIRSGDRLIVDRSAFMLRNPRRWEAVLFREPEHADRLGLKRIVGLPGESVWIEQGDVVINGKIARKTLAEQRRLVQLVDRAGQPSRDRPPRWRPRGPASAWRRRGSAFYCQSSSANTIPDIDWLVYHHPGKNGVTDDLPYNPGESRLLSPLSDLMLVCQVTAHGPGELDLQAASGGTLLTVRMRLDRDRIELLRRGRPIRSEAWPMACVRRPTKLEFSSIDAQIVLAIAGTVCLRVPCEPNAAEQHPVPRGRLAIGCRGISARIERLEVWRDVYYTRPRGGGWGIDRAYQCGPDEVFLLGDNSPIAYDSRRWPHGGLPQRLLVGRVLARFACRHQNDDDVTVSIPPGRHQASHRSIVTGQQPRRSPDTGLNRDEIRRD